MSDELYVFFNIIAGAEEFSEDNGVLDMVISY